MLIQHVMNVTESIEAIESCIFNLSIFNKQDQLALLDEIEKQLTEIKVYNLPDKVTSISQYPDNDRNTPKAIDIIRAIKIMVDRNEKETPKCKDYVKELEAKLKQIYNSSKNP